MRLPTMEGFDALPLEEKKRRMEGLAQTFEDAALHVREQSARREPASQSLSDKVN